MYFGYYWCQICGRKYFSHYVSCVCILLMFSCPVGSFVLTVMFMLAFIHRLWVAKQIIGKSHGKKFFLSIFQEFQ